MYRTLHSVHRMDCEAYTQHDEIYLATLTLSDINPPTIQHLMNKINDISGKLITSDIPVDDAKRSVTLQRAVKYNGKYAATVASFRVSQIQILVFHNSG